MSGPEDRPEDRPLAPPLVPEEAFETGVAEGTLGVEEELWLSDPETLKLAGGAQKILAGAPEGHFSGELIDCEIESNSGVHEEPRAVAEDLLSRRRELFDWAEQLDRVLGTSGTHPIGKWREQEIIETPHYRRLEERLAWIIKRNNTFALHVHYAIQGKEKAVYLFNRLREYVPHLLALSVNSPFWEGEHTQMLSSRTLIFSRSIHRAGLPEPLGSWDDYLKYVDFVRRSDSILKLGEIWWDIRPHPVLDTMELRPFEAQTALWRSEALINLSAALCDLLVAEYDSGEKRRIQPNREIEENKWNAQRHGLDYQLVDHETHEGVPTRRAIENLLQELAPFGRDLSGVERILDEPTEAARQLEVWRESGSLEAVVREIADRSRASLP